MTMLKLFCHFLKTFQVNDDISLSIYKKNIMTIKTKSGLQSGDPQALEGADMKVYADGHFVVTIPGLPPPSPAPPEAIPDTYKPPQKVSFSGDPMRVRLPFQSFDKSNLRVFVFHYVF